MILRRDLSLRKRRTTCRAHARAGHEQQRDQQAHCNRRRHPRSALPTEMAPALDAQPCSSTVSLHRQYCSST
eukprot:2722952-Rhodomonas_salina.2